MLPLFQQQLSRKAATSNLYNENQEGGILVVGKNVNITSKLNIIIRIHVNITNIFDFDTPIIFGYDGYTLTPDDLEKIEITIPAGYSWKYDEAKHDIVIYDTTTDINNVSNIGTNKQDGEWYDTIGHKLDKPQKGINIFRGKDGKAKKVIKK